LFEDKASLCIDSSAPPVPSSPQGAISLNCRKQRKKEGEMNVGEGEGELRWSLWRKTALYLFTEKRKDTFFKAWVDF